MWLQQTCYAGSGMGYLALIWGRFTRYAPVKGQNGPKGSLLFGQVQMCVLSVPLSGG